MLEELDSALVREVPGAAFLGRVGGGSALLLHGCKLGLAVSQFLLELDPAVRDGSLLALDLLDQLILLLQLGLVRVIHGDHVFLLALELLPLRLVEGLKVCLLLGEALLELVLAAD